MSTARAKINAIREAETQYSNDLIQPLRLVAKNFDCTIRSSPHPGEITPYVAQGRILALQFGTAEIKIENARGEIVFHGKGGELIYPDDEIAFWRKLGV